MPGFSRLLLQPPLPYCGTEAGTTGPVETKLGSLGEVLGVVVGAFAEGSEALHSLIHHLAISRVRVAGPQKGKRGQMRTQEAEIALTTSFLSEDIVCLRGEGTGQVDAGETGGDRAWGGNSSRTSQLCPQPGENLGKSKEGRCPQQTAG